ncbi:hypothetical protein PV05_11840 [Exophiala xenobiotica]|uniref:Uncharacterized protein n=1 Tax=Exophiala xenobiotica TaxID=348802 RepID=A0A0D2CK55_9EURO|nr:uncharacterized protein PV05_11840 [Exophiala xenobiotica]KIW50232.1 hypothetical protein PV05_11840 [Exophiala xenobiotica]
MTSRPGNMPPLSVRRHDQDEVSDMYAGSFTGSRSMTRGQAPGSVLTAPDVEDVRSTSSSSGTRPARSGSSHSNHSSGRSGSRSTTSSRSGSRSTHSSGRGGQRRVTRSKRSYRDPRISAKARISFAFGITLVIAIIIYLVLVFTGTARGIMFHVLSILLILTLAGVFFHQLVSMLMLRRRPVKPRYRAAHSSRHQHARRQAREAAPITDELPPEKPIQIHMASDDGLGPDLEAGEHPAVRKPPPTYGNTRTSMRINPDFVYAKQVVPSPVTPTYD